MEQLSIIGVPWPPPKRWKRRAVGMLLEEEAIRRFVDMRDRHIGVHAGALRSSQEDGEEQQPESLPRTTNTAHHAVL